MAGTATAALTAALKTTGDPMLAEALWRNNELMPLFKQVQWQGGATYNTKIHYGGNTSVHAYAEGDAPGVAGSQSYLTAQHDETHYMAVLQISGHVYDQRFSIRLARSSNTSSMTWSTRSQPTCSVRA